MCKKRVLLQYSGTHPSPTSVRAIQRHRNMRPSATYWGGDIRYVVPPNHIIGGDMSPRPPAFGAYVFSRRLKLSLPRPGSLKLSKRVPKRRGSGHREGP